LVKVLKNLDYEPIDGQKKVKLTIMKNIVEIMSMEKKNLTPFGIKKINGEEYIVLATGEVKKFQKIDNRSQDKESLRKTFKKIRQLINANFVGAPNELCFTITYKENMTDTKILYKDFDGFMKKLRYKYKTVEYINVVEPQGRGAWHCHVLLRFDDYKKIFIPNKEIAELWGHGFVKVKAIRKNIDNLGAYLSAYLGDVELQNNNISELIEAGIIKPGQAFNVKEVEVDGIKKKFIKGGRLVLYPPGMNIYRTSRGIKQPEIIDNISYDEAKKIVGGSTPTYSTCTCILDNDNIILNSIIYEQYNLKRLKNK